MRQALTRIESPPDERALKAGNYGDRANNPRGRNLRVVVITLLRQIFLGLMRPVDRGQCELTNIVQSSPELFLVILFQPIAICRTLEIIKSPGERRRLFWKFNNLYIRTDH